MQCHNQSHIFGQQNRVAPRREQGVNMGKLQEARLQKSVALGSVGIALLSGRVSPLPLGKFFALGNFEWKQNYSERHPLFYYIAPVGEHCSPIGRSPSHASVMKEGLWACLGKMFLSSRPSERRPFCKTNPKIAAGSTPLRYTDFIADLSFSRTPTFLSFKDDCLLVPLATLLLLYKNLEEWFLWNTYAL